MNAYVQALGHIWQPGFGYCAMTYPLERYELAIIGDFTRENVRSWLDTYAGDFQSLTDFSATDGTVELDWADEMNECHFNDAMFGDED